MPSFLCLSARFLQPFCHARGDGGEPEWPPSPLRMFQALVAAAGARWRAGSFDSYAKPALGWLGKQPPPVVVAAAGVKSDVKYRLYVPDNVADKVAKAWKGGNPNATIADYRTEKDVRPTHLSGDAVHYLYELADGDAEFPGHFQTLQTAARGVTHLGWGVDMVVGNAAVVTGDDADKLPGERWGPTKDGAGTTLRVPVAGTLDALVEKHAAFLGRLQPDGFKPVPPLTAFETVGYARGTDPVARPWAAFRIQAIDPDHPNPAFDTARKCAHVAAWVRHAVGKVCKGWPDCDAFVHGHAAGGGPLKGDGADQRFLYLPLPSIEKRGDRGEHVGAIRRVLVAAPPGRRDRTDFLRQRLPGRELEWVGENGGVTIHGLLDALPASDWVLQRYTGTATVWSTVTPVVWPGHDDDDAGKAEKVLRKAFVDAGLSRDVVDGCVLEWRPVGFRAGVDLARRYEVPENMRGRRSHVRVRFATPVRGPLAVGAGRYRGFGLFVAEA